MIGTIFNTIFYNPLYNGLIILLDIFPWMDLGLAVIVFTIIVKLVLFPLSQKQVKTQLAIKKINPKLEEIKEKYKDKQEQAVKTMEVYKEEGVNPFSGILLIFIQIPIIFALYFIFFRGGFPEVNTEILYSFVSIPENIKMTLFGILDVSKKSFVLALLAGVTQFFQARFAALPTPSKKTKGLGADFARSMSLQMKYVLPIMIFFIAWTISAAVSLYWATSNLFMIGQELYIRRGTKEEMNKKDGQG